MSGVSPVINARLNKELERFQHRHFISVRLKTLQCPQSFILRVIWLCRHFEERLRRINQRPTHGARGPRSPRPKRGSR